MPFLVRGAVPLIHSFHTDLLTTVCPEFYVLLRCLYSFRFLQIPQRFKLANYSHHIRVVLSAKLACFVSHRYLLCDTTIDIHRRSQTSFTAPCNGVVSHWAQIGGLRPRSLRALRHFTRVLSSRSDRRCW